MRRYHDLVQLFAEHAAAARAAKQAVDAAFRAGLRAQDPAAYRRLLDAFLDATNLAMPRGAPDIVTDIRAGDADAIETAIAFLQADGYFFRSGYEKARIIRALKRAAFTPEQRRRLHAIVLERVDGPDRNEYGAYCRLALAVRTPELEAEIERKFDSPDPGISRRALWMLERFEFARPPRTPDRKTDAGPHGR